MVLLFLSADCSGLSQSKMSKAQRRARNQSLAADATEAEKNAIVEACTLKTDSRASETTGPNSRPIQHSDSYPAERPVSISQFQTDLRSMIELEMNKSLERLKRKIKKGLEKYAPILTEIKQLASRTSKNCSWRNRQSGKQTRQLLK